MRDRYRLALTDWLACAHAGRQEPAALAARSASTDLGGDVVAAATAGHVLDFDDTFLPGIAHLSAPTAPVAVLLGARIGATVDAVLGAYAAGFEAMGAVARASHPRLYDSGWHATAVCGVVGAAITAADLLQLDPDRRRRAANIAVLSAGGFRAAFGSHGKSVQVGFAAASGLRAAQLAAAGVDVPDRARTGRWGFEDSFDARWAEPDPERPAVGDNWIKRYPCCLQTHGAIEVGVAAAERGATAAGSGTVTVHPLSRQAAPLDEVRTGLEAKFSIPYCTALAVTRGHPTVADFLGVDEPTQALARRISVVEDAGLLESEAHLSWQEPDGTRLESATKAAVGSPDNPMTPAQLQAKLEELGGGHLPALLAAPDSDATTLGGLFA